MHRLAEDVVVHETGQNGEEAHQAIAICAIRVVCGGLSR